MTIGETKKNLFFFIFSGEKPVPGAKNASGTGKRPARCPSKSGPLSGKNGEYSGPPVRHSVRKTKNSFSSRIRERPVEKTISTGS